MAYDPVILRRWAEILPTLDELGLEARHDLPEDTGGDRITIHRDGETEAGRPLAMVRFIEGGWYVGSVADQTGAMRDGERHRTIYEAFDEVVARMSRGRN